MLRDSDLLSGALRQVGSIVRMTVGIMVRVG